MSRRPRVSTRLRNPVGLEVSRGSDDLDSPGNQDCVYESTPGHLNFPSGTRPNDPVQKAPQKGRYDFLVRLERLTDIYLLNLPRESRKTR